MLVKFNSKIIIDKDIMLNKMKVIPDSPTYIGISKTFDKELDVLKSIAEYEAIYLLKDNNFIFDIEKIDKCKKIVFCFATIGNTIIDKINSTLHKGDYLEGYLLNEISDELVMNITRQMHQFIKCEAKKDGYNLTKRYSPGECGLDLKYQKTLLDEIKKQTLLDAQLTDSYMIIPEKSTLFMYGVDKNIPETDIDHDCSNCKNSDCTYRK